jgi:dynactin-2
MEQLLVRRGSSVDQLKLKLSRELGKEQRFGLLNIEPEHTESSKLTDMERRITNLERLIGTHLIDPMSALEQDSGASLFQTSGTLIGALERIDSHLSLLANPKTLQAATDRISEAISRIHELQALRQSPEFEEDEKISYLYNMLKRFEPMTAFIPHLIGRLEALQDIHAEAALFSEGLHDVETSSKQLAHLANCITENQKTLLERIKENQQTILQNISKLASV